MLFLILGATISALLIIAIIQWDKQMQLTFRDRNVPFIKSNLFGGSFKDVLLLRKSVANVMMDVYSEATKRGVPCIGVRFLHKNCLVLRDLELIKRVLVKDFNHFSNRSAASLNHDDLFGRFNLFLVKNPFWHEMRSKITPLFTTSRMRQFFETVNEMGDKLNRKLAKDVVDEKIVSPKYLNGAYTTDVYASCAFGVDVNFIENPDSVFGNIALEMFNFKLVRALEFGLSFVAPEVGKILPAFFFSKNGSAYLKKVLSDVMAERRDKGISRNDLMDVLVNIKSSQEESGSDHSVTLFDDDMLLAQSVIFFVAGFETTSTALTHALYELARNPHIQLQLKEEIACHSEAHGKLTYDNLSELKYLTMVCQEVFRLYPAFSFLNRECTPDNGQSTYSLLPEMDFDVPKGLPVYIPIYALHRDEKYFPEPDKIDPHRFSAENIGRIPRGAYLPFGMGPRSCLAERLAYMAMKIGLVNILRQHSIEQCPKTPKEIHPHNLAMLVVPDKKIFVRIRRDRN